MLSRRKLFSGLVAGVAAVTPAVAATSPAGTSQKSVTYMVPKGIRRIRVRSWKGDREIIDTHFSVEPGQMFKIDAA